MRGYRSLVLRDNLDRRDFLKISGAAGIGFWLGNRSLSALAQQTPALPSRPKTNIEDALKVPRTKYSLLIFLILLLASPIFAQLIDIGKFKGVEIPFRLKIEDHILEKGQYDLEALKNRTTPSCYLRIKKGTKILCLIEGERLQYETYGMAKMTDPNIPQKPRLKMKRNVKEKIVYFMVETGRDSLFPYLWLRFKLDYEE